MASHEPNVNQLPDAIILGLLRFRAAPVHSSEALTPEQWLVMAGDVAGPLDSPTRLGVFPWQLPLILS